MIDLGEKLKNRLEQINDQNAYNLWLSSLKFDWKENSLIITTSSQFTKNMIKDRYSDQIKTVVKELTNKDYKLLFKWENFSQQEKEVPKKINVKTNSKKADQNYFEINPDPDINLCPKFTFDSFVVGKNNQLACAAAKAVVASPGTTYNPLFIYGKTGLGKTHLMQAIGHAIKKDDQTKKIAYIPCEEFMNLMIEAIKKNTMNKFRSKFRRVDILMIDDIQFLAKKEQTQEEFFNTFNALYHDHKQIVLTSDCQPKELTNLQERLVSRFEWGLVTDVQAPSYETRVSILKKKSELSHFNVSGDVMEFLAEHFIENVRQIEGALNRVYTYAKLINKPLTIDLAREILKDLIKSEKTKRITVDEIIQKVAQFYHITILQIQGPKRHKNYALPRQVAMYVSRNLTDLSYPEIGTAFGGRDHTTVLHACRKIEDHMEKDSMLKDEINSISQLLTNG